MKTPPDMPDMQELKAGVRKLTRTALFLSPAAFVVGAACVIAEMKTIAVACWTVAIFCVVSSAMINGQYLLLERLEARRKKP